MYLGAFVRFRFALAVGWSVMFGWLTVFNHWVFHYLRWVLGCMLLCIGADGLPVGDWFGAGFWSAFTVRVVAWFICGW